MTHFASGCSNGNTTQKGQEWQTRESDCILLEYRAHKCSFLWNLQIIIIFFTNKYCENLQYLAVQDFLRKNPVQQGYYDRTWQGKKFFSQKKSVFFLWQKAHLFLSRDSAGTFFSHKIIAFAPGCFLGGRKKRAFVFEDPWFFLDGVEGGTWTRTA